MIHVWSELLVYVIKFLSMLVCAGLGIMVGKKIRKNKDVKIRRKFDVKNYGVNELRKMFWSF